VMEGGAPLKPAFGWCAITAWGKRLGDLTNGVFSYRLKQNIGFALIASACRIGDRVEVHLPDGTRSGTLTDIPFL
jgi:glycine cleavage system aminomethyltransferase T